MNDLTERNAAARLRAQDGYESADFQRDVRDMIDAAIRAGISHEDVQKILEFHRQGVPYYYDSGIRYDVYDSVDEDEDDGISLVTGPENGRTD